MRSCLSIIFLTFSLIGCTRSGREEPQSPVESLTPAPLATGTRAQEPAPPEAKSACSDDADFIEDLTVPDGSQVGGGEIVDKRWSVENSGSCDWVIGYRLIPEASNPLVDGRESALYPAKAGANAIWRVSFLAPDEPGEYIGSWQAFNPRGQPFGDPVFVLIEVVDSQAGEGLE